MRKLLFGAAVLVAAGWIGGSAAWAFTKETIFAAPDPAAPLADSGDRLPLFDHSHDPAARSDSEGRSLRLPGGGFLQFHGRSSNPVGPNESHYFGRMPDSVQPNMR